MPQPVITYQDISPTAKEDAEYTGVNKEPYADLDIFKNLGTNVSYAAATLEWNMWKLDGQAKLFPDDPSQHEWGMASSTISDSNGNFSIGEVPVLTISFDDLQTSVAITCDFDKTHHEYPSSVEILYYNGISVLDESIYEINTPTFAFYKEVENYNKIEIRVLSTLYPYRRARISSIYFGIIRTFTDNELEELSVLEEVNPISAELSINQMNFSVRNTSEIPFLFQKMQPLVLTYGDSLIGQFFIDGSKRKNKNFYQIECIDNMGILDKSSFFGGMYNQYNAKTLIDDILLDSRVGYYIDPAFYNATVTGYIPICTKREALLYVCFAIGAIVGTGRSTKINIVPLDTTLVKSFTESDTYADGSVDIGSKITGVSVTSYSYIPSDTEREELYNGILSAGITRIKFDKGHYDYVIDGGVIVASHVNYCDVQSDGLNTAVLRGYKYKECTALYTKLNPNIKSTDVENQKECDNCTLVNPENAQAILDRLYDYYMMVETINTKVLLDGVGAGDTVKIPTVYDEDITCILTSVNISFGTKMVGEVTGIGINNK